MEATPNRNNYRLIIVERAEPLPAWLPEGDWHRYVLEHSESNLVGYHRGTLSTVKAYAETVAADLNARTTTKKFSTVTHWRKRTNHNPSKDRIL